MNLEWWIKIMAAKEWHRYKTPQLPTHWDRRKGQELL